MSTARRQALRARREALLRFDAWARRHPMELSPAAAVAAAGRLFDLLPPDSRNRSIDPRGVLALHRLLRRASGSR